MKLSLKQHASRRKVIFSRKKMYTISVVDTANSYVANGESAVVQCLFFIYVFLISLTKLGIFV